MHLLLPLPCHVTTQRTCDGTIPGLHYRKSLFRFSFHCYFHSLDATCQDTPIDEKVELERHKSRIFRDRKISFDLNKKSAFREEKKTVNVNHIYYIYSKFFRPIHVNFPRQTQERRNIFVFNIYYN